MELDLKIHSRCRGIMRKTRLGLKNWRCMPGQEQQKHSSDCTDLAGQALIPLLKLTYATHMWVSRNLRSLEKGLLCQLCDPY